MLISVTVLVRGDKECNPSARIPQWRSLICPAFLIAIDDLPAHTIDDLPKAIATVRQPTCQTARSTFTHDEVRNNLTAQGVPKLYFEQFYRIRDHLDDIRSPKTHKLARRALTADWPEWEASNYKQLSQFAQQRMFADPIPAPPDASVFNWLWADSVKTNDA
jgi:hypothetical protein